jgi:hypothetical protein
MLFRMTKIVMFVCLFDFCCWFFIRGVDERERGCDKLFPACGL